MLKHYCESHFVVVVKINPVAECRRHVVVYIFRLFILIFVFLFRFVLVRIFRYIYTLTLFFFLLIFSSFNLNRLHHCLKLKISTIKSCLDTKPHFSSAMSKSFQSKQCAMSWKVSLICEYFHR